jgi:antirestriction protein ArdC
VVSEPLGKREILLDQKNGTTFGIEPGNDIANFVGESRAQSLRRLVHQDEFGVLYQRPGDSQHLLLTAWFGSRNYGAEELIAELGAAFLCAEFGFDGDLRHAGYIAHWIELLKADKRAFFTACSQASKAADYLRGLALAEPTEVAA